MTLFEELGGEARLRAIVDDFLARVFADPMIGFFFARVDRALLGEREYEHAAALLGADVAYSGRPLALAHAPHPIRGGHFLRRLVLLQRTLADHGAPAAVVERWLAENAALRPQITADVGSECAGPPRPAPGASPGGTVP